MMSVIQRYNAAYIPIRRKAHVALSAAPVLTNSVGEKKPRRNGVLFGFWLALPLVRRVSSSSHLDLSHRAGIASSLDLYWPFQDGSEFSICYVNPFARSRIAHLFGSRLCVGIGIPAPPITKSRHANYHAGGRSIGPQNMPPIFAQPSTVFRSSNVVFMTDDTMPS